MLVDEADVLDSSEDPDDTEDLILVLTLELVDVDVGSDELVELTDVELP